MMYALSIRTLRWSHISPSHLVMLQCVSRPCGLDIPRCLSQHSCHPLRCITRTVYYIRQARPNPPHVTRPAMLGVIQVKRHHMRGVCKGPHRISKCFSRGAGVTHDIRAEDQERPGRETWIYTSEPWVPFRRALEVSPPDPVAGVFVLTQPIKKANELARPFQSEQKQI